MKLLLVNRCHNTVPDDKLASGDFRKFPTLVVYRMSELGLSLKSILDQLDEWGERYMNQRDG
ncbi:winged helix-turn-helix transcriptional regulator [Paenibacillus medicaginis]|uniref:Winged helix-turn-helix transcriptional regulator n=1 Tax=Paenibacillus medicaginis TaxID=1470560 RepID=A0ABV5C1M0_9BACL